MKFDHIQYYNTDLNKQPKFERSFLLKESFKLSRPSMFNFVYTFKCYRVKLNFAPNVIDIFTCMKCSLYIIMFLMHRVVCIGFFIGPIQNKTITKSIALLIDAIK